MAKSKEQAKAPKAKTVDLAFLQELADKMNKLIEYEVLDDGSVDASLSIDLDMSEKALKAEIIKRAKVDIYEKDNESFHDDEWQFLLANGVVPQPEPDDDEEVTDVDDDEVEDDDKDFEDDDTEDTDDEEPASAPKKGKPAIKKEPEKKDKPKPSVKKDGAPNREQLVASMIEDGATFAAVLKKLTEMYRASGKDDAGYIEGRAKIYWNIGCKKLGKTDKLMVAGKKELPAKEEAKPKAASDKKQPQKAATSKKK